MTGQIETDGEWLARLPAHITGYLRWIAESVIDTDWEEKHDAAQLLYDLSGLVTKIYKGPAVIAVADLLILLRFLLIEADGAATPTPEGD